MATKQDIKAGKAFVELFLKNSIAKGLQQAQKQITGFGKSVMSIGATFTKAGGAITAPLAGAAAHFATAGDALDKMAKRTGATATNLAELGYAAEQSGASLGDIESALAAMTSKGRSIGQFDALAESIAAIENPLVRAQRATAVFGSAGAKLLPMLGSLKELRKEAQAKGLIPSEQAVQQAAELSGAFTDVKRSLMAIAFEAGAAVAPLAKDLLKSVVTVTTATIKWIKENQGVIRTVAMIGAGLLAAGGVITAVGAGLVGLGTVLGGIATVITGIGTAVGLLLSPIGLLTAGLVGGIYAWTKWTSSGQAAVSNVTGFFRELFGTFTESWQGIVDAISAGDLALAGKVAMAGLNVVWQQGVQAVNKLWQDAKWWFLSTWNEATTGLAEVFTEAWAGLQRGWVETIAFLRSTWTKFSNFLQDSLAVAQMGVGNVLIDAAESSGAVSSEFAKVWREELNRPLQDGIKNRQQGEKSDLEQIETDRINALEKIANDKAGALGVLDEDRQREQGRINAQYEESLSLRQKELEAAKAELAAAIATAKAKREQANKEASSAIKDAKDGVNGPSPAGTFGSFMGAALKAQGYGAKKPEDKIIAEQKRGNAEIVKHLVRGNQLLSNMGFQVVNA